MFSLRFGIRRQTALAAVHFKGAHSPESRHKPLSVSLGTARIRPVGRGGTTGKGCSYASRIFGMAATESTPKTAQGEPV